MAISNAHMIKRMEQELHPAKFGTDEQMMHTHLGHVRLLCDILLDEKPAIHTKERKVPKDEPNAHISGREMKPIMGYTSSKIQPKYSQTKSRKSQFFTFNE